MSWEDPELDTDEAGIIERILLGMADRLPGWTPVEGAPEVALAEEIGRETAATNALAVESLQLAIAGIAETVFGLAPRVDTPAILPDVELTLLLAPESAPGDAGTEFDRAVTIPAGFTIATTDVAFTLLADVVETVTFVKLEEGLFTSYYQGTVHIEMTATTPGTLGNLEAGTAVQILTNTPLVSAATLIDDGAGGLDAETLAAYLDRVTDYLSVLRPGAARADGLAALARTVSGVHRAIGFDLYDPAIPGTPQERTATVVAIDSDGQPVDGSVLTDLTAQLEAAREVNFNVILDEPTYTDVEVEATVTAADGVDHTDLDTRVTAAITAFLDPASWGNSPDEPRSWTETSTVRSLDIAIAISQVAGVASVVSVIVNDLVEFALPGKAALPSPVEVSGSTVAVTVT